MPVKRKIYGAMSISALFVRWLPWLVFALSLFITYLLWQNANEHKKHVTEAYFESHARDAEEQIKKRLGTYEQVLRGLKGLMVSSEDVTREEFKAYVSSLDLQKHYPGIQALAFVKAVPAEEKEKHIHAVRKEGFPEYSIVPAGERPFYTPIVYLECFSDISLYNIGFDTYSDPVRREVMEKSRSLGDVVISEKVNLVQTDTGRVYPGFLMYFPVYKLGSPYLENAQKRCECISGWVAAPFIMENLMPKLLEDSSKGLEISIYDGKSGKEEALLYDSDSEKKHSVSSIFESTNILSVSNHKWLIRIRALPSFKAGIEEENTNAFIYAGVVIGILLSLLVHALVSGRFRAEQLVRESTEALKENETLLGLALEGSIIGMWEWNIETGETHFNENWAGIVGYKLKELAPLSVKTWLKLCHPDDLPLSRALLEKHFRGESPFYECEARMRHKNGSWIWVLDRGSVSEWSPEGKPLRMVGTHIDITHRKEMEIELSNKTALLTNLLNSIPDIIFLKDMNSIYLGCNPAFASFVGKSEEKVIGHTDHDLFPKHIADEFRKHDKLVAAGGKSCNNEEWLTYPDGRRILVDTIKSPLRSAGGECIGILGVARDITARKLAEEEIQYHSRLSQMLVEISDKFINIQPNRLNDHLLNTLRQIGEFVHVDRCYIFMFSHEDETMSNICEWVRQGFESQREKFQNTSVKDLKYWMDKLRNNETIKLEKLSDLPPGAEAERRIIETQSIISMLIVPINEKGVLTGFLGFDSITEFHAWPEEIIILMRMVADIISNAFLQKRQLEQLSQAGKNFDTFFNTIDDLLFVLSSDGTILHVNDTASRRLGYSRDEMIGRNIVMVHSENDREEAIRIVSDMIAGKTLSCPLPVITKNRLAIPVETRVVKGEWNGKPALFGVTKDISQLKLSEQKFSGIFQQTSVIISISKVSDGMFMDVNEAFLSAFGFVRDEVIGKTSFELNIFNDFSDRAKMKAMFEKDGEIRGMEVVFRKRDGTLMTGLFGAVPIDISGDVCWLISVVDISELKMTEEKLRDSEEKFRLLLDSTGEGIYGLDMDGNCTFCNKSALWLLGYTFHEELLGKNMHWAIHHHRHNEENPFPIEECRIFQALHHNSGTHVDDEVLWRADGTSFPAEYWAYPQHQGGKQIGAVVTFYDITERKEAEHQIKQNLREKEMLLREIHHRVKNNMAVISSLLGLQADATADISAKEMLEESQQRIKSMALVHEKLYRSNNIANIDFHDYVSTIVMELSSAYAHEGRSVETGVTADDVILDVDTAIPCGLILNELVTNAFKYAFKSKGEGRIDVSFTHDADNSCTLSVKDNGVGLPPGFDHSKSNTLGLQIVSALTKQLRGAMHVNSVPCNGTEIIVKFKNRETSHGTEKHTDS